MTFSLGFLRAPIDPAPARPAESGAASASTGATYVRPRGGSQRPPPKRSRPPTPAWRLQLALLVGGVAWVLVTLALVSHDAGDAAFSTTGTSDVIRNRAGLAGAWLSDIAFFLCGYSAWWAPAIGLRAWLGVLATLLRSDGHAPPPAPSEEAPPLWAFWLGVALLLAASCSLEWTRLYQWEGSLPNHAGGALGYTLGASSMKLFGFAGSGVLWIAILLAGLALAFRFSWLGVAERLGARLESLRARGVASFERAEDARIGEKALREREKVVEVDQQRKEAHEPIVVTSPLPAEEVQVARKPPRPPKEAPQARDGAAPAEGRAAKDGKARVPSAEPAAAAEPGDAKLPQVELLDAAPPRTESVTPETLEMTSRLIEKKLKDFGVEVRVVAASPGPVITRYEIEPATGVKGSQVVNLAKDLSRSLSLVSIRVVETIPGRTTMALELPNARRQTIRLSEILGSRAYADAASQLTIGLGKDIVGAPIVADLARMPHCLVAGTTGSGKSVGINAMILSLLYKAEARDVRLILIDPKMLEMSVYEGIPHLLAPVVTDMKQAANALNWGVGEMERRYKLMSKLGVRNLAGYNKKIADAAERGERLPNPFSLTPEEPEPLERLPYVVIVIDELADLMMVVGKKIEELIARLAQKARAAGIHLILATQRPSVDVITGLIKANIPTRLSFQVSSKIDSRTILDQMGAEALLGQGDMLYLPPGGGLPVRVHGAFVSDDEVHRVVSYLKSQGEPNYVEGILEGGTLDDDASAAGDGTAAGADAESDPMYDQAVAIVVQHKRASISLVQRHLRIGYNRAARLLEQMEKSGLVSAMATNGNRDLIVPQRDA